MRTQVNSSINKGTGRMTTIRGKARIGTKGIRKHFDHTEPADAVIELAWNGFDAKACLVEVLLRYNDLGTLSTVDVFDNGDGIDFGNIDSNFGRFNESSKAGVASVHGQHGRGRFAFDRLADRAIWYTRFEGRGASISVTGADLESYECIPLEDGAADGPVPAEKGTRVVLHPVRRPLPDSTTMDSELSREFGWYLAINPGRQLFFDGRKVVPPAHDLIEQAVVQDGHEFSVSILRWHEKPASERSRLYLLDTSGTVVHLRLNSHNKKPGFYTSVIVQSAWADGFVAEQDLLALDAPSPASKTWRAVEDEVVRLLREAYNDFQRTHVEQKLLEFEEEGSFPDFAANDPADAAWRRDNIRSVLRAVMLADPGLLSVNRKQRAVFIRLIDRLSVGGDNGALLDVLQSVLELAPPALGKLASQLRHTTLDNIVQTIDLLQQRHEATEFIRQLMRIHYRTVGETPELQRVIEQNTWLFGPQFATLGAEETTFTEIARRLRTEAGSLDHIEDGDVEDVPLDVSLRQPDLFLVRQIQETDSLGHQFFRWVIIEIKRPSVALNFRHLRQLEDYKRIIEKASEFSSEYVRVDLILVGRKISQTDTDIRMRLKERAGTGTPGLIATDERFNMYVLNWETLLDGFQLTHIELLTRLRLKRTELEVQTKDELLTVLAPTLGERGKATKASSAELSKKPRGKKDKTVPLQVH